MFVTGFIISYACLPLHISKAAFELGFRIVYRGVSITKQKVILAQ